MNATDRLSLTMGQIQAEAEELQKAYIAGDSAARERLDQKEKVLDGSPTKRQALRAISSKHGFGWTNLLSYLDLDQGVREVIEAVRLGDLDRLRALLREHPEAANPFWPGRDQPPKPIPNDSIPLFVACYTTGRKADPTGRACKLAQALLEAGADPDIEDSTPLNCAASFNRVDFAEILLDGGAKVDGASDNGGPLAHALFFGWDVAKLLEKRGAKLDLRMAAGLGRTDAMSSFFNEDGTLKPEASALSLMWSQGRGFSDGEVLAQALVNACIANQVEAVAFLLDRGTEIDAMPKGFDFRTTGLHRALRRGNTEVAKLMIERGADLALKDGRYGRNALDWAMEKNLDEIAKLVKQKGKD